VPDLSSLPYPLLIPLLYALTAAVLLASHAAPATRWQAGRLAAATAVVLTVAVLPVLSGARLLVLPLITVLGGLILRYSTRYLDGAATQQRYVPWLLLTLAGASLVVVTGDLVVLALAWTLTSLALHQLLSVGDGRPGTAVMAHKKFILSRVADVTILSAVALIVRHSGSTSLDRILAAVPADTVLPTPLVWGTALLAGGIVLRSAQLPFHGWLLQVMEAPTPVSALLHAGIVNLGAFVLIALAPLMGVAPIAQALLIITGATTAVLAALAMTAQSTIKSALAWSTCAQMGFVLVECGLGAYDLALVHVIAHGLYKAHAFLNSGRAVRRSTTQHRLTAQPSVGHWTGAVAASGALVATTLWALHGAAAWQGATLVSGLVLALAVAPALASVPRLGGWAAVRTAALISLGLPTLYALWHLLLHPLAPPRAAVVVPTLLVGAVLLGFALLFVTHIVVTTAPAQRLARALYPHAVHGFHLDTLFTRLTFRLWPPRRAMALRALAPAAPTSFTEQAA
jgi:NAD(P)H-quinone oxidoreductase subunit 5